MCAYVGTDFNYRMKKYTRAHCIHLEQCYIFVCLKFALRYIQIDDIKSQLNFILLKAVLQVDEILASMEREHLSEHISSRATDVAMEIVKLENDLQWKEKKVDTLLFTHSAHIAKARKRFHVVNRFLGQCTEIKASSANWNVRRASKRWRVV